MYDSDIDGQDSQTFRNKILNHQHLYFIVTDSDNNVFGHYHDSLINKIDESDGACNGIYDSNFFMFSLHNKGDNIVKKFAGAGNCSTCICPKDAFFFCRNGNGYYIYSIGSNNSYFQNISDAFNEASIKQFSSTSDNHFTVKRLVVMEMK